MKIAEQGSIILLIIVGTCVAIGLISVFRLPQGKDENLQVKKENTIEVDISAFLEDDMIA